MPIGVNINLKVESQTAYYGKAVFGNSDWLDSTMSLVNYGDRGVPNVFLNAPLGRQTQKKLAGEIEKLLLEQTPIVIPYWIDGLTATTTSVHGVNPTAISQVFLGQTYKS